MLGVAVRASGRILSIRPQALLVSRTLMPPIRPPKLRGFMTKRAVGTARRKERFVTRRAERRARRIRARVPARQMRERRNRAHAPARRMRARTERLAVPIFRPTVNFYAGPATHKGWRVRISSWADSSEHATLSVYSSFGGQSLSIWTTGCAHASPRAASFAFVQFGQVFFGDDRPKLLDVLIAEAHALAN